MEQISEQISETFMPIFRSLVSHKHLNDLGLVDPPQSTFPNEGMRSEHMEVPSGKESAVGFKYSPD